MAKYAYGEHGIGIRTFEEILAVLIIIIMIACLFMQPYFEMRAFNRMTKGPKASYWDAVFSELRIITVEK